MQDLVAFILKGVLGALDDFAARGVRRARGRPPRPLQTGLPLDIPR
jgi:hypothetical protein